MKFSDLIPDFTAFKSATKTALDETKSALAARDKQISDLAAKLEAIESASKVKADDSTSDDSSVMDQFISDLQDVINKYTSDESDDSTDDSTDSSDESDSTDSDAAPDDTDDSNDESAKKATRAAKLKLLAKGVSKIVADNKKLKDELPKQVIRELAAIGIPTPVATKVEGQKPTLHGRARVAAAFAEQFNNKK